MHGLIHVVMKNLVLEKFGADQWSAILSEAKVSDEDGFLALEAHSDDTTVAAVVAASKVLGASVEDVLRLFGEFFAESVHRGGAPPHVAEHGQVLGASVEDVLRLFGEFFAESVHRGGHLRMLQSMGDDLRELVRNLNNLHYQLERSFRTASFPSFTVADADGPDGHFKLSYYSLRGTLLIPVVEGVLPTVARRLFHFEISMVTLPPEEGMCATWLVAPTIAAKADAQSESSPGWMGGWLSGTLCESSLGWLRGMAQWHAALMCGPPAPVCLSTCGRKAQDLCCADIGGHERQALVLRGSRKSTTSLDDMVRNGSMPGSLQSELDYLASTLDGNVDPGEVLMRSVVATNVACSWTDVTRLDEMLYFWGTNIGSIDHFQMSCKQDHADFFVSHSWAEPPDWCTVMGCHAQYAEVKAAELQLVAADLAEERGLRWEEVTFWIDKCCIPQQHQLMVTCVHHIEDFLQRCDRMIVLLTWHYFSRLWCVYEWAAFLAYHDAKNLRNSVETFMRPASRDLYLNAIPNISIQHCKCHDEKDRVVLKQKIVQYYVSEDAFENFAKGTAVAMMAMTVAQIAGRSDFLFETEFVPWIKLAYDIGQNDLANALLHADPV
eukprot:CAMPEP_0203974032 /NCGR_PEP_ID=MMETSP0359-20131031/99895_1 /ASSEMBLY_ACC=CAM_ASM_000338 /TAXON_ID=268821 /ORGANISM="Scrippsiella Hangoei, Strain SHTV-5" /LENGTH=607 /DNA_ID=CAMNT_0050912205 /DNA_START=98 /DNA_END=1917 /DNA_ORIENTATION=+